MRSGFRGNLPFSLSFVSAYVAKGVEMNQLHLITMDTTKEKVWSKQAPRLCSARHPMQSQTIKRQETWLHPDACMVTLVDAKCPHCGAEFEV